MGAFLKAGVNKTYFYQLTYLHECSHIKKSCEIKAYDTSDAILSLLKSFPGAKGSIKVKK